MRTMIIGDVHGCSNALKKLLEKVQPTGTDKIVMLGDLFDRGPDSYGVFETVRALAKEFGERFVLLRGNHEDYLLAEELTFSQRMVWSGVGRGTTFRSFRQHDAHMEDARPFLQEKCQKAYGHYPARVLADTIFRTRENLKYCKEHGIHLNGPKLGKPFTDLAEAKRHKKLEWLESGERGEIERHFGVGKRRYSLDCIVTKLKETSEAMIHSIVIYINLRKKLRLILRSFSSWLRIVIQNRLEEGNFALA